MAVGQRFPLADLQSAISDLSVAYGLGAFRTSLTAKVDGVSRSRYSAPQMSQVPRKYRSSGRPNPPKFRSLRLEYFVSKSTTLPFGMLRPIKAVGMSE